MCVTEQYVISGLPQCQGQGDIWHLLLEHVVMMVSVSAWECSQPVAGCECNINVKKKKKKKRAPFSNPLSNSQRWIKSGLRGSLRVRLPPALPQFSPPPFPPCLRRRWWGAWTQAGGFRTRPSSVSREASGLRSPRSPTSAKMNQSKGKQRPLNVSDAGVSSWNYNKI